MKQSYPKRAFLLSLFFTSIIFAQTPQQINNIKKETNVAKLTEISAKLKLTAEEEKKKAWILADQKGWKKRFTDSNGVTRELVKVSELGTPIYYKTDNTSSYSLVLSNATAAQATRANWLHNGGGLGLNVEGQGLTAHVWDGGTARPTHQEYDGIGGTDRVSLGDSGGRNFHAAHVMGTVVSSGLVASAKGMAPQAQGIAFDWNNDDSEIATAASNGMLVSNHSYGFGAEDIPDAWFGAYLSFARVQDEIMYNAPYYLQVISAGNDGNDNTSNASPLNSRAGFDKLSGMKTAKNNIIVANGRDPDINNSDGSLISVVINSSSSEGPTDDLRIKPDITGNGTGLFSTFHDADDSYNTLSGTSMAAPNVTGSLLLLQQHYNNLNNNFMRAATLKGLALHTADDVSGSAGLVGPDAVYGWGLMNTKKAAETISSEGLESIINELVIKQGETLTFNVRSDGTNPLLASISWTDMPGDVNNNENDGTPALVNDLDIRVSNTSETYLPWRLTGVDTNEKGDNIVDPYERVDIENASGEYTITISHKGTLQGEEQNVSLIVTGVISDFTIALTDRGTKEACSNESSTFNFSYIQTKQTTTNLSLENLPDGVTGAFSSDQLTENTSFTVTLENLNGLTDGTYSFDVVADNGNKNERRTVDLKITTPSQSGFDTTLSLPANSSKGIGINTVDLEWEEVIGATSYDVEVSRSPSFSNLDYSGEATENNFSISGLTADTVYYWRVKAANICQEGGFSEIFSFQTVSESCDDTFDATITNNTIGGLGLRTVTVDIDRPIVATRLKVNMDISHNSVGDLSILLREPAANGGTNHALISNKCSNNSDFSNITFDDLGNPVECNTSAPALTGAIKPEGNLTVFKDLDVQGTWVISISDLINQNGAGTLNSASITVCTSKENTSIPTFTNNGVEIAANDTHTFSTDDFEATSTSESASDQRYTLVQLPSKGILRRNGVDMVVGDTFTQEDINNGLVTFSNTQTELFSDTFKVDILNASNGWLPNQTITLTATTLSNERLEINGLNIFPNPTAGDITVTLNPRTQNDVQITLFDLQGRTVFTKTFKNTTSSFTEGINVRSFSNGVYLLTIKEGSYTSTRRIIISK